MKKNMLLLLVALVGAIALVWINGMGEISVDGVTYGYIEGTGNNVVVTAADYSGSVVIPDSIVVRRRPGVKRGTVRFSFSEYTYYVTGIGYGAFENCTDLTSATISKGIKLIDSNAFAGCTGLISVNIPDGITDIKPYTFSDCQNLTSITLPESVMFIGNNAFYNCSGLTSVTIPENVKSIGSDAFAGCSNLAEIVWNAKCYVKDENEGYISSLFASPFDELPSITSFAFGESVDSIPRFLCKGLTGLTSITIPDNVKSVGWQSFAGCTNLKSIYYHAVNTPKTTDGSIFEEVSFSGKPDDVSDRVFSSATLYVPYGSKQAYMKAGEWSKFKNIVEMELE